MQHISIRGLPRLSALFICHSTRDSKFRRQVISPMRLANEVLVGTLDLGLVVGIPPTRKLSCLKLAEQPMYIGMKSNDPLAILHEIQLSNMHNRIWALFSKHL